MSDVHVRIRIDQLRAHYGGFGVTVYDRYDRFEDEHHGHGWEREGGEVGVSVVKCPDCNAVVVYEEKNDE